MVLTDVHGIGLGIAAVTPEIFMKRSVRNAEEYERIARPKGPQKKKKMS